MNEYGTRESDLVKTPTEKGGYSLYPLIIHTVKRLNNSTSGNPRFDISFSIDPDTFYTTQSDAAINYEVTNYEYESPRRPLIVSFTKSNRIYNLVPVK
jgi:dipeptidyl aminopeptidase/acylaminoacyl peptidase